MLKTFKTFFYQVCFPRNMFSLLDDDKPNGDSNGRGGGDESHMSSLQVTPGNEKKLREAANKFVNMTQSFFY